MMFGSKARRIIWCGGVVWLWAGVVWSAPRWEKIIDDGEPGYSETGNSWRNWKIGSAYGGDYRYLSHYDQKRPRKGKAIWQTKMPYTGKYEVSVHFRQTVNRTPDADYKFKDGKGKPYHIVLNQRKLPTGWHKLGEFHWTKGQVSQIVLDGTDDNESDEADAVRWRYVGTGGPPPKPQNCQAQKPGSYTLKAYAAQVRGAGDWKSPSSASGAPNGRFASSPNVDAADVLSASDFKLCTPPGKFTITKVRIGVLAKMQYDSGPFKLVMYLEGSGKRYPFSQKALKWTYGDITRSRPRWTIADANNLLLKAGLNSHPGGKRDSDAWVDAFVVELTYQVLTSTPTCPKGQTLCGGRCVVIGTDRNHCGVCGQVCAASQGCVNGRCALSCPKGSSKCGNQCFDLARDPAHCGGCGKACRSGQLCSKGQCATTCQDPMVACGAACIDTSSNASHCGGCGKACREGEGCVKGVCRKACSPSEQLCAGRCVDVQRDNANCGACGRGCTRAERCEKGRCVATQSCSAQELRCADVCVNVSNDDANCGACGRACASEQSCRAGQCRGDEVSPDAGSRPDLGSPNDTTPEVASSEAAGDGVSSGSDTRVETEGSGRQRGCGCATQINLPQPLTLWGLLLLFVGFVRRLKRLK